MSDDSVPTDYSSSKGYALSGKIMLSAMVILFFIVLLMVVLHLYARWYLLRVRRRQILRRARHRRTVLLNPSAATITLPSHGLDPAVLRSLPIFVFTSKTHESLECSVCLSEFEDNETGRLLPKCNHSFHIDCIDMWFESHSTCPLCRSPVESGSVVEKSSDVVISVGEPAAGVEPESSSELCRDCRHEEEQVGPSSFGTRRKPSEFMGVSIEVPKREVESGHHDSPTSQALRSPMSRMLSLKRILSRDKRGSVSPSAGTPVTESDTESTRQTQCGTGGTE